MNHVSEAWINIYRSTNNQWVTDSLSQEFTDLLLINNKSLISFVINSSFINQHFAIDHITKLSYLDTMLVNSNLKYYNTSQVLFNAFNQDLILQTSTYFLPFSFLIKSEYQDTFSIMLITSPELSTMLNDYIYTYIMPSNFTVTPAAVFDSYTSNWSFFIGFSVAYFLYVSIYYFIIVYFVLTGTVLKWTTPLNFQFIRFYYYQFSVAREIRFQVETLFQTIIFFALYWITTLMTFDDNQEEVIEFVDGSFFYFFIIITLYICFKYSIHYFAFLEASVAEGRSVGFIAKQVFKDFLNTLALFLRFYILLLRVNVYDTLDDFLDSYYIFIGDFDEDEYLNEMFLSIYGSLLFLSENDYDTSYLFEDEHDFFSDLFYLYFVIWGKLFYFTFFMLEEAARLSLAFYVCYLIIFEVHSVNCSYKEDNFFFNKRYDFKFNY